MGEMVAPVLVLLFIALVVLLLMQRWFWVLALLFATVVSSFAMLASIVDFQILGALGFFFLTIMFWFIVQVIAIKTQ
jgi:hypothetical protein